jgi:hypothetical protein
VQNPEAPCRWFVDHVLCRIESRCYEGGSVDLGTADRSDARNAPLRHVEQL